MQINQLAVFLLLAYVLQPDNDQHLTESDL